MKTFVFRLQSVLDQRQNVERQRQRDLAQAQRTFLAIEAEITAAKDSFRLAEAKLSGRVDARVLLLQARYQSAMRHKLARLTSQAENARRNVTTAQAALVEAAKQRKVLEKLRENQQSKFHAEQRKRETLENDDDAARRISRDIGEEIDAAGS
jgi:flagellar FliJ protein